MSNPSVFCTTVVRAAGSIQNIAVNPVGYVSPKATTLGKIVATTTTPLGGLNG